MEPLVWWVLLFALIILITAFSLHLCFNLLSAKTRAKLPKLTRYQFEKTDVEDLTSIEKNLTDFHPHFSFVDEFGATPSPRSAKRRKGSLLTDVHESVEKLGSFYSLEDIMEDLVPRRFSLVTEGANEFLQFFGQLFSFLIVSEPGMRRNSLAALPRRFSLKPESRATLNYADPLTIETLTRIAHLDDQTRGIEYEIDYFFGHSKNLKFYELNEKLIRVNLALSELECNEELRHRKRELQSFIAQCKDKLNGKVA